MITLFLDNYMLDVYVFVRIDNEDKVDVTVRTDTGIVVSGNQMKIWNLGRFCSEPCIVDNIPKSVQTALWCIYNEVMEQAKKLFTWCLLEGRDMCAFEKQFERWNDAKLGRDVNHPCKPVKEECKRLVRSAFSELYSI